MRKLGIAVVIAILGISIPLAIDRDPFGALTGHVEGRTTALQTFELAGLDDQDYGIAYFTYGDFSALNSETLKVSAAPWVLATSLLALREGGGDPAKVTPGLVRKAFRRFGFHFPKSFGNWPAHLPMPQFEHPLGQNVGFAARLVPPIGATIGNIGCAACHAGVMYDKAGRPDLDRVWLGSPNTSINLEGYTDALYQAMREYRNDEERLWTAVDRLFPDLDWRERLTLRYFIIPALQKRVDQLEQTIGRLLPFRASLAGATNGLDSLKRRLGMIHDGTILETSVFNSIPDLGGRVWRSMLLNSGTYAVPGKEPNRSIAAADIDNAHLRELAGITAYFTVPSMGVTPEVAEQHIDDTWKIMTWMAVYRPQPFPGPINERLASQGREIYAARCATCHGHYGGPGNAPKLLTFPNWSGDIGTDGLRAQLFSQRLADTVNGSIFGKYIKARSVKTYTAPPLTGIWSSAPYFHNGSVPTLWHLMNPMERPKKFYVGGHAIDLENVGIAGRLSSDGIWIYPDHYQPWSEPVLIDTTMPGLANTGHEAEFVVLDTDDQRALIEFMKLL